MRVIEGFEASEVLYRSSRSAVYRGRRASDGLPVVLKCLERASTVNDHAYLRYSYELLRGLTLEGVVQAVGLASYEGRPVLVMKDGGGRSSDQVLKRRPLSVPEVLRLGCSLAATLGRLHQHQLIHQDIRPSNVVINEATGDGELIDFQLASRLSVEPSTVAHVGLFRGSLAFIAPEHTGRTQRTVDHRSDLYSFGTTLFFLLTGRPPFQDTDPLRLIHRHVASTPPAPHDLNPLVPETLSRIVLKLLAKGPAERYQSAYGVEVDLRRCLASLDSAASAHDVSFEVGRSDVSSRFLIPDKLYGRQHEIDVLLKATEETSRGGTGLLLVSGAAGVGKSDLVSTLGVHVAAKERTFLTGKFDQLHNVPYTALLQSVDQFVQDVLDQPEEEVKRWQRDMAAALGGVGRVLVERAPALAKIIGPQPEVPALPPNEAFNRILVALVTLLKTICSRRGGLVIFLDDLQWAGANSIRLLESILTSSELSGLLVIGAYRDTDVDDVHPVRLLPENLRRADVRVNELKVSPLSETAVQELVADTLAAEPSDVAPLSSLVFSKTKGDPFFVKRFLRSVHSTSGIGFDATTGKWRWDLERIAQMEPGDNVAQLISGKLLELPEATREMLSLAACLSGRFTLQALASATRSTVAEVARALWPAVQEDVLIPLGKHWRIAEYLTNGESVGEPIAYRFSHDHVRLAAYELVPARTRQEHHVRIGRSMLEETDADEAGFFESVNQLNSGPEAIGGAAERLQLCELNLTAGRRARDAGAFSEGFTFIKTGLDLLPDHPWVSHPDLTLKLHLAGAELAYLVSDFDEMERLVAVSSRVEQPTVRAELSRIQLLAAWSRGEPAKAVAMALEGLAALGIRIPRRPSRLYLFREIARVRFLLRGRRDEDLVALPVAADANVLAATNILGEVLSPSYTASPELYSAFLLKMLQLAVKGGTTPVSSLAFAHYAVLLIIAFRDTRNAKRFGDLALRLADHPACRRYRPKTLFVIYDFLQHWHQPIRNTIEPAFALFHEAREVGDLEAAALAVLVGVNAMINAGVPLPEIAVRAARYSDATRREKTIFHMFEMSRQVVFNLMGQSEDPHVLKGETGFDEFVDLPSLEAERAGTALCGYHINKFSLAYILQRYRDARRHADLAVPLMANLAGSYQEVAFLSQHSLACLSSLADSGVERQRTLRGVRRQLKKLQHAAARAPMNFAHLADIVAAELARVTGDELEATNHFERALAQSRSYGFLGDEAMGSELAGRFHLSRGRDEIGRSYLRTAYEQFARWGSEAKLDVLAAEFPWIAAAAGARSERATAAGLDAESLLRASQAISGEIVLADLLKRLMDTVVESAGANRAVLFLQEGNDLEIAAQLVGLEAGLEIGSGRKAHEGRGFALSVVRHVERTGKTVMIGDTSRSERFGSDLHFATTVPMSVLCQSIVHQNRTVGILYLENSLATDAFSPDRVGLLNALSGQIAVSLDNARLYERLQQSLSLQVSLTKAQRHFVPTQFLEALGRDNITAVSPGDHVEKELSILFSDVRGFTALSEAMTPSESIGFINTYLGRMEPSILKHGGFIDSYIGDAVMALFDTDADRAVMAALEMLRTQNELNEERVELGQSTLRTGIGIHTGPVMLGTIGGRNHLKCGVIGDAVNLASRVEGLTKRYARSLLITESTRNRLTEPLRSRTRMVDRVRVAGRQAPVSIFEVFEDAPPSKVGAAGWPDLVDEAVRTYHEARTTSEIAASLELFERCAGRSPDDPLPLMYIERCRRHISGGIDASWDGVEPLLSK